MKTIFLSIILTITASALEFDSVRILPRQDDPANAQVPKRWTIETSADGITWALLQSGGFENTLTEKILTVPATRARFLRFNSLESHVGKNQSALAEITVWLKGKEYSSYEWKASSTNEVPITANPWGPASYAIDGEPQTCWHTTYEAGTEQAFPHSITIDFGEELKKEGSTIELEWDANPEPVTGYVVAYGNRPDTMTQTHASSGTTTTVPNLPPGEWFFAVKALSGTAESEYSTMAVATLLPPISPPVVVPAPKRARVVKIETSANLTDWAPVAFVPLENGDPSRFIRASIQSAP